MISVAFYNLENLFDVFNDAFTNDDDFLPESAKHWTPKRYQNKLRKLSFTIANIAKEQTHKYPILVGLAEVENNLVLNDLIDAEFLDDFPYNFVHYDSPDERGIDVALLYDKKVFKVLNSYATRIELLNTDGTPDYTRDILTVKGVLNNELVYVLVNHWPSRSEGVEETAYKRMAASNKLCEVISEITKSDTEAKIIVMGDFNDDPDGESVKNLVHKADLYNPMKFINRHKRGSLSHDFNWNLFDQILISTNFFEKEKEKLTFVEADVFDADFLKQYRGKYKDTPFRTYVGKKYKGGYSDHFPVYLLLKQA